MKTFVIILLLLPCVALASTSGQMGRRGSAIVAGKTGGTGDKERQEWLKKLRKQWDEEEAATKQKRTAEQLLKLRKQLAETVISKRREGIRIPWVVCSTVESSWNISGYTKNVTFTFTFMNLTKWIVKAVEYEVVVYDSFGDEMCRFIEKEEVTIDRWFIGDPNVIYVISEYDTLYRDIWQGVKNNTLKYAVEVKRIVWVNGKTTGNGPGPDLKQLDNLKDVNRKN